MIKTRFAPSPTGYLHLGHAYSALAAAAAGDVFLLRIDDIDYTRCRPQYVAAIEQDLRWLKLSWDEPVTFQSDRLDNYGRAFETLRDMGMLYPCFMNRKEMADILSAPHETPAPAPCTRGLLSDSEIHSRIDQGQQPAWRLDTARAITRCKDLFWFDASQKQKIKVCLKEFGDVVIARKDIGTSYHLSVVVDDAIDDITLVTRGDDLASSTHIHRALQALLDLPVPDYWHHPLVRDTDGRRLAKRDNAAAIRTLRDSGLTAAQVRSQMPPLPIFSQ